MLLDGRREGNNGPSYRGNVIYLSTFSKTLSPGMRLGWIIAPAEVIQRLVQAKQGADLHSSTFAQMVTYEVARGGFLDQHVQFIRATYRERRDAMLSALERHMPDGVTWTRPQGGLFLWVRFPEGTDAADVLKVAIDQKVAFVPGQPFFPDGSGANTARFNFSYCKPETIEEGIRRLGAVLKSLLKGARSPSAPARARRSGRFRRQRPASLRAAPNTSASICGVSLPVFVFCRLGWNEATTAGMPSTSYTRPWPKRGAGFGRTPRSAASRQHASNAIRPSATITRTRGSAASSATRWAWQRAISAVVGRLSGGAHRATAVTYASVSRRPSSARARTSAGWRSRGGASRACRKSPDPPAPSPVNIRPVRFAPCAAGARPSTSTRACGSPKPGTGRPQ